MKWVADDYYKVLNLHGYEEYKTKNDFDFESNIYIFWQSDDPDADKFHFGYITGKGDDTTGGSSSDYGRMRLLALSAVGLLTCLTGALAPVVYS